ncbi:amino acid ABC transporter substrate-binding protein [Glaciecola sp. MH2013]|uniref:amino acid ABC transporter substrate-binding protein n=1 Tax=Glaciecola sp. MH2013 TaxID=2785524 RepID=UPI0018A06AF6|nr:amino acid ABC transporter substrate-binding protein [Glaciecola sp. MH2013]MBF7072492.1 amino acid ABC transporter substrate-binding protein [Glaciecola sp. MH2013]
MMFDITLRMLLMLVILASSSVKAATWVVTYPGPLFEGDKRHEYPEAVLKLALEKTGVRFEMRASERLKYQAKALRQLRENIQVNVVWSMTDRQREDELLPIRIPIAKGLIGWRVLLTHQDKPFFRKKIDSLADLQVYSAVQGLDWPDTKILQANGFNVLAAQNHTESSQLISRKQADFYPRSVIEVLPELNALNADPDVKLKNGIALHYKAAMYFFVNKKNVTLARVIEVGLQRAIEDGSFDALFYEYHGNMLTTLALEDMQHFELENPLLPINTPIFEEAYWYSPLDAKKDVSPAQLP